MDLHATLVSMAVGVVIALFAGWRGARMWDLRKGPRLMPWRLIMLFAAAWAFYMAVRVVDLLRPAVPGP